MDGKIRTLQEAIELINDGDTVAIVSAGLIGYPEFLSEGIRNRFDSTGHPRDITITGGCGHANPNSREIGDAKLGKAGLLRCYYSSHPMTTVPVMDMIANEEIEGYSIPQGILNQLYRSSAANQPGILSKIGLGTYVDPRQEGGRLNKKSSKEIVRLMEIDGEEWLYYKTFPVNVALIRATTADESGNLSIEQEALKLEILETALAAKAQNGIVIAQVKQLTKDASIDAKSVVVPGEIVDAIVVAEEPEKYHRQTAGSYYNPYYSGELIRPDSADTQRKSTLAANDIICRRAAMELYPNCIVNVGLGIGAGVPAVAEVEGFLHNISFTLELGAFGGVPCEKSDFGAALNPSSFIAHASMFDYYHGGNLDITFLGAAEMDQDGNVNVSKINGRNVGQGGFIDISMTSKKSVFVCYFTAKGLKTRIEDGKLMIEQDGKIPKLVNRVAQITYNGKLALEDGHKAVYVTERAVFELSADGLVLTEIAPGVDLEKDIIGKMGFQPKISSDLKQMDGRIFLPGKMGIFD